MSLYSLRHGRVMVQQCKHVRDRLSSAATPEPALAPLFGEKGLLALARTRQQHQALAADVARAQAINARMREDIRRLTNDPTAIEELARRELGLIKPGEKLFIIRDVAPAGRMK
jgi:hypothetical protein